MYKIDLTKPCHAHFIGIGGTSMSGLARMLKKEGYSITGSDSVPSRVLEKLRADGIPVYDGHSEEPWRRAAPGPAHGPV